jgi:hypothetical protein
MSDIAHLVVLPVRDIATPPPPPGWADARYCAISSISVKSDHTISGHDASARKAGRCE